MNSKKDPKSFGEVFAILADMHRTEGTVGFVKQCLTLGKVPTPAGRWWLGSLLVTAATLLFVFYQLIFVGHSSFNTSSDGVNWGMAISTYVYFALISSGLTMIDRKSVV